MPSQAYRNWKTSRAMELDQVETAHTLVGGTARGRRYTTQQINRAYAVLLASQFQGLARDLHTEAVMHLVGIIPHLGFRGAMRQELLWNRQLDTRNANQATIGGDFGRLGIPQFWMQVDAVSPNNPRRRRALEELNAWRNAIAHQAFDPVVLGGMTILRLARVRRWRRGCNRLARAFDSVVRRYIQTITGTKPW
jgi:hypothetical protein